MVGGLEHLLFSIQLGFSSSQLMKSRGRSTTNQSWIVIAAISGWWFGTFFIFPNHPN